MTFNDTVMTRPTPIDPSNAVRVPWSETTILGRVIYVSFRPAFFRFWSPVTVNNRQNKKKTLARSGSKTITGKGPYNLLGTMKFFVSRASVTGGNLKKIMSALF